jgi:DNA-binding transcriptional ArsR family regulator
MSTPLSIARPAPDALAFFKALADETRLAILRLLALTDLKSGEIVA